MAAGRRQDRCSAYHRLKERERWTLLDKDRAIVVHLDQPPKIIHPDGRVEAEGANGDA